MIKILMIIRIESKKILRKRLLLKLEDSRKKIRYDLI